MNFIQLFATSQACLQQMTQLTEDVSAKMRTGFDTMTGKSGQEKNDVPKIAEGCSQKVF